MDLHQHLRLMADYHHWAYARLFAQVDRITDADYRRDAGLFFASIHGTLNHLLLVEHVWQARLNGPVFAVGGLDQELESDRFALKARTLDFASGWRPFVDALTPAQVAGDLDYRSLRGDPYTAPYATIVLHVFNHATHHRGQISGVLTQIGATAPEMDLPYFLPEWKR